MGATDFYVQQTGRNAREAFADAKRSAQWESGHGGYSGTIAEKPGFTIVEIPAEMSVQAFTTLVQEDPIEHEDALIRKAVEIYNDKWGPACCILLDDHNTWAFFGIASE